MLLSNNTLARTEVDDLYSSADDKSAWMTKWNVKHSFSSPMRVQEIMRTASYLPGAVKELEVQAKRVLAKYLGKYQIRYITQFITLCYNRHTLSRGVGGAAPSSAGRQAVTAGRYGSQADRQDSVA